MDFIGFVLRANPSYTCAGMTVQRFSGQLTTRPKALKKHTICFQTDGVLMQNPADADSAESA